MARHIPSKRLLPWLMIVLTSTASCAKKPPIPVAETTEAVEIAPTEIVPPSQPPVITPPQPAPVSLAEVNKWMKIKAELVARQTRRQLIRERLSAPFFLNAPAVTGASTHLLAAFGAGVQDALRFAPFETTASNARDDADLMRSAPLKALRAARRAIAENPTHPDPYYALAQVLQDPDLPLQEAERAIGIVTAYRQCLVHLPSPERYKRGQFLADPAEVAFQLANSYLGPRIPGRPELKSGQETTRGFVGMPIDLVPFGDIIGQAVFETPRGELFRVPFHEVRRGRVQVPPGVRLLTGNIPCFLSLDVARDMLKLAFAYATADQTVEPSEAQKRRTENIEKLSKDVGNAMIHATEQYSQEKRRGANLPRLVESARRSGLTEEALKLLSDKDTNLAKEYGDAEVEAVVLRITLELALGRIENASELLTTLSTPQQTESVERGGLTPLVQTLKYQKSLHAGEYKAAGEVWEALVGRTIGLEPLLADITKHKITPNDMLFAVCSEWPPAIPGGGLWPATIYQLALAERSGQALAARQRISEHMQNQASFFYRRGVLSLLEGDIPAAKQRFLQTDRKAPPGWHLPDVAHTDARRYLLMIERAEKKAAP